MHANGQSDAQQAEIAHAAVQMTAGVVAAFAPHLTQQQAVQIAASVLEQQEALGQVMADAIEDEPRAKHPSWGCKLHNRAGKVPEPSGIIRTPKAMGECETLSEVMHYVTIIALLTSPTARGVLAAYGYDIEFLQGGKPRSPLIQPGRG
jgi:hypothetical protein